jgi:serine kinase of HPr protein (carbohydrate metabolism regulator)
MTAAAPQRTPVLFAVHATALVVGEAGLLIRGRSGAGKSSLADAILAEAALRGRFARLVGDDSVRLSVAGGRLLARPHPRVVGLIERRGVGLARVASEPAAVVRLVIDLGGADNDVEPDRMPAEKDMRTALHGVSVARLRLKAGLAPQEAARRALMALDG